MAIFSEDLIVMDYLALDKKSCLQDMAEMLEKQGALISLSDFLKAVLEREAVMSTGIGKGVALPHARIQAVKELKIVIFILRNELDFESLDNEPVKIIFMVAVPENMKDIYLKILSAISNFCRKAENRQLLLACRNKEGIFNILKGIYQ
ncbi:MAG: PTS sugar transporter subunit IIA [Candidatus Cloacimonetes bacterium]|nr:PTS sugar transporter subunit IIA [Candidatus Cloacimonadota bacterium]